MNYLTEVYDLYALIQHEQEHGENLNFAIPVEYGVYSPEISLSITESAE